jgi:putative ABC transport system permease protein
MGVSVLRGRSIAEQDQEDSPAITVINEAAARWLFPDEDPIGKRLVGFSYDPIEAAANAFTIVGVVANVRSAGLSEEPRPEAFFAHGQVPVEPMFVVVRTTDDPFALTGTIRREIAGLDSNVPVPEFRTMEQVVAGSLSHSRLFTSLLSLFSIGSLILACIGLYGVVSRTVAQRSREIGIRMALGAQQSGVLRMIVGQGLKLALAGIVIGALGAFLGSRLIARFIYGISTTDPATFVAVALLLICVAMLASYIPARRAARVDPMIALRSE